MSDYPVKLGSMLFTLVDPQRGHERAYNRWYERDHFYAGCMVGPWILSGRRWVATRALKDLRFPKDGGVAQPWDAGSYLAIYWIHAGHHDDHFDWAGEQVQWLYANGRGFAERSHVHTVLFDYATASHRDPDPVPVELALDHPYAGLVSVFLERSPESSQAELGRWLDDEALPGLMHGSPIASAASFRPISREGSVAENAPMDLGSPTGGPERHLQLFFLEDDPRACWDRFVSYGDRVKASGLARVLLAAPFLTTVPGTDRYTDELW